MYIKFKSRIIFCTPPEIATWFSILVNPFIFSRFCMPSEIAPWISISEGGGGERERERERERLYITCHTNVLYTNINLNNNK
jgi:hypothetical protein